MEGEHKNMKKMKTINRITSIFFIILLSFSFVNAIGITQPQPQNIELKPGQSSFFTLQVQSDDFPLKCVPIVRETGGLELAFNQEYNIGANQAFNIKPQVIVPKETGFGNYQANFCLECTPSGDFSGSRVVPVICNLPVSVNVVSERTRENRFDEAGQIGFLTVLVILSIAILILAVVIFFLVARRKRVVS